MFSDHICDHIPLEKSSFSWVDFHSLYHPHQCRLLWRSSESPPRTLPHFSPQFLDFCQTFIFKLLPFKISFFKISNRRKLFTFNYYISWSLFVVVVVVQLLSRAWLFVNAMDCNTPGFPVLHYLPEFAHPLSPFSSLPSIFPSIRVFSNESVLRIQWPKYWSFSFSISPSSEYSWLISFRID